MCGGWDPIENDRLVAGQRGEKIDNCLVAGKGKEGVIPLLDQMGIGQILDLREIHDHAVGGIACLVDDTAGEGYFDDVAVPMQVAALAFVVRDAVPGIEFEAAGNQHGLFSRQGGRELYNAPCLPPMITAGTVPVYAMFILSCRAALAGCQLVSI